MNDKKNYFHPANELCGSKISSFNQITTLNRNKCSWILSITESIEKKNDCESKIVI
jgi:hypothetical protein